MIGYLWLFAAMVLTGMWFVVLRMGTEGTHVATAQLLHVGGTVVAILLVYLFLLVRIGARTMALPLGQHAIYAFIAGFIICAANLCMFKAYGAQVPLGIVAVIMTLNCLIPVVYGVAVLHEELRPQQVLGVVLAVAAACLLSYPYAPRDPAPAAADHVAAKNSGGD